MSSWSAASTVSTGLLEPDGASWLVMPIRQRLDTLTVPFSGSRAPVIKRRSVVLPVPLRPTNPTRCPALTTALARSNSTRSPIRYVRLSIRSMAGVYTSCAELQRSSPMRPCALKKQPSGPADGARDAAASRPTPMGSRHARSDGPHETPRMTITAKLQRTRYLASRGRRQLCGSPVDRLCHRK